MQFLQNYLNYLHLIIDKIEKIGKVAPKPKKYPEINMNNQEEEYCDLSIIITNEEIYPEKSSKHETDELIQSAKQSLIELQNEAKICMDSSKKFVNDVTKKLKSSFASTESYSNCKNANQNPKELLESLTRSVHELNERLSVNEEAIHVHVEENSCLKSELKGLQEKFKEQQHVCKLENAPIRIGCTCELM